MLFVDYTFTRQALKITEAMESLFHAQGWESTRASIEFVDARDTDRFRVFPLEHRYLDIIRLLPAQLRRPPARSHFTYLGGQIRSLLSLISYLGTGEYATRSLGVRIPTHQRPARR